VVKNGSDRLVVLNRVAASVIESRRGQHPEYVFTYRKHRIARIHNTAWRHARLKAARQYEKVFGKACPEGFRNIRVHDLKHTFGRRLRAAGVSFEDRQDLLGHRSRRVTTHYSAAELRNLVIAANRACGENTRKSPEPVMLRRA
jgi:integrase